MHTQLTDKRNKQSPACNQQRLNHSMVVENVQVLENIQVLKNVQVPATTRVQALLC